MASSRVAMGAAVLACVAGCSVATTPNECTTSDPPSLTIGSGRDAYAPLARGAVVRLERGPQGGHHLWLGVRQRGFRRTGSTITIRARTVATDVATPTESFVLPFVPEADGSCSVSSIRYVVDASGPSYLDLLDRDLDLWVNLRDADTHTVDATLRVHVAASVD